MRQRTTYFAAADDLVDPATLIVTETSVSGPDVAALLEHRLTLTLDELPADLRQIITRSQAQQLHIRWDTRRATNCQAAAAAHPLFSRLNAGLHVLLVPTRQSDLSSIDLCTYLKKVFGELPCSTPNNTFTVLPDQQYLDPSRLQYFHPLRNLTHFSNYASHAFCSSDATCAAKLRDLTRASSLDISYDATAATIKVTASWPRQSWSLPPPSLLPSSSSAPKVSHRMEIGFLGADRPPSLGADELGMSGHVIVLGQDDRPKPVLFSFASRHRRASSGSRSGASESASTFTARFVEHAGMHPKLQLDFNNSNPPPVNEDDGHCSLNAYFTLPRAVFPDRNELVDPLFLASKNIAAARYVSQPIDLEAPEYAVDTWGSAVLLELAPPKRLPSSGSSSSSSFAGAGKGTGESWQATLPLHIRYHKPSRGGYADTEVPYPTVFWACDADDQATAQFDKNPFDRVHLGYDDLFDSQTVFWHLDPQPRLEAGSQGHLVNSMRVPVMDTDKAWSVNVATPVAIIVGFLWVAWKLVSVLFKHGYRPNSATAKDATEVEEKNQKKRQ